MREIPEEKRNDGRGRDQAMAKRRRRPVAAGLALSLGFGVLAPLAAEVAAEAAADPPGLVIGDVSLTEGHSGTRWAIFPITRTGDITGESAVDWGTVNGTATSPQDFVAASGTAFFMPDQPTQTVAVRIVGDTVMEENETFSVQLSAAEGATVVDGSGTGTIVNDEATFDIDDVTVTEGPDGTTAPATFTITRRGYLGAAASVGYATANGTATAPADYCAVSGTASFAAGVATQKVTACVRGDAILEASESFEIQLSAPTGAAITDAKGIATIIDDDQALSISDASAAEGNGGTTWANFKVTRTGLTTGTASATWRTEDGSATADSDYCPSSGTVILPDGMTSTTLSVCIKGDGVVEPDETFRVLLSAPVGASLADGTGIGTITNDDSSFSVNDVSVIEGSGWARSATFTITRAGSVTGTASVGYATQNGSALAGSDYTARTGTATFGDNVRTVTVPVALTPDQKQEPDETFVLKLSAPSVGVPISDDTGVATILNDDASYAIADASVTEGKSGTTEMVFTVSRTGNISAGATVPFTASDGTARWPDYKAGSGSVSFAAGQATSTAKVQVVGDIVVEGNETIRVLLGSAFTSHDGEAIGTIVDDDAPSALRSHNLPSHHIRHRNYVGVLTELPTAGDIADGTFKPVTGLANIGGVSFESVSFPGWYLRHQDFRITLQQLTDDALFRADATFLVEPGLADPAKMSFRSWNYRDHFIRHAGLQMYIQAGSDQLFRDDSTYDVVAPPSPKTTITVPWVTGETEAEATRILQEAQLQASPTYRFDESAPCGEMVERQDPEGGELAIGSPVRIFVVIPTGC